MAIWADCSYDQHLLAWKHNYWLENITINFETLHLTSKYYIELWNILMFPSWWWRTQVHSNVSKFIAMFPSLLLPWNRWAGFFMICENFSTDFSIISWCDFSMIQVMIFYDFWSLRNDSVFDHYVLIEHYIMMTLLFRIQWNNGWVPLEVIWKQFRWSVALRHLLQQKAGRRGSEDRSFRKLKSRIFILDSLTMTHPIWLIQYDSFMGMTHPPLRFTQATLLMHVLFKSTILPLILPILIMTSLILMT